MNRNPVLAFPSPEIRSFSLDPKTKEIVIRVHVGDHLASDVAQTLHALEQLVGTLRRTQEFCERQHRTDERIAEARKRHIELARSYQRLRNSGVKHRAAIRALFVDPSFSDLNASTADIAYWVKAYVLTTAPKEPK